VILLVAGRITTQLGTPRGRYDEYSSKFSLSKKPRFNRIQEKAKLQKVMLTSLVTLQQGRRLRSNELARLQLVATWNLHTTQPNTLLPTYDEVVNLTGLLETKE
jgi:hypothetical protein